MFRFYVSNLILVGITGLDSDMGVCVGGCPIPTFKNFNLRDFFFANSDFNITFGSETFRSFNSSKDDLNIV